MALIKASENKQNTNNSESETKARSQLFLIRILFVVLWLAFSGTIFVIALLTDINWMRPSLEQIIGQSVHRNVKLGHLSWHFGMHGLFVETSRLLVSERTGDPFLMAGNCEIGFSLLPLMFGMTEIHYVDMQNPLFMAIRTGPQNWNFDDLLVVSPDIDLIQCHKGHVFVVDRSKANSKDHFPDAELNKVEIKLKNAGQFSPARVDLSFELPDKKQNYNSQFHFESAIWGKDNKPWWEKKCHYKLFTKHFTLPDWQTLISVVFVDNKSSNQQNLPWANYLLAVANNITDSLSHAKVNSSQSNLLPITGQFDLNLTADGTPAKKFGADVKVKIVDVSFKREKETPLYFPIVNSSTHLELKEDSLAWDKFTVDIADYKCVLSSSGEVQEINDAQKYYYQGNINGSFDDLKKLNSIASLAYNNIYPSTNRKDTIDFKNLDGKLLFNLRFNKSKDKADYNLEAKANDINVAGSITPVLAAFSRSINNNTNQGKKSANLFQKQCWEQLGLSKQAKFSGTIEAKSDDGFLLKDCRLDDGPVNWKVSGKADNTGSWTELLFYNQNLQLAKLSQKLKEDPSVAAHFNNTLGLAPSCDLKLDGKAQIAVKYQSANKNEASSFACETVFEDADVQLSQPKLAIHHLNGTYVNGIDGSLCKNIHFDTDSGAIEVNANVPAQEHAPLAFHLYSKSINVSELFAVLQLFHIDISYLNNWQLSGKIKNLDLLIGGTVSKPLTSLVFTPEDLVFVAPGLKQQTHANSGKVIYANDALSLEKVNLCGAKSKVVTTLVIKSLSRTAVIDKMNLATEAADLVELQNYFSAALVPPNFRNSINSISKRSQIQNLTGNVSGVLEQVSKHGQIGFNGIVNLNNIDFKYGDKKLLCHGARGSIVFTDKDLVFHDIAGNVGDSTFTLHGRLTNYQEGNPQLHGEINAQIIPDHLDDVISLFTPPGKKPILLLQAKKPISVKFKCSPRNNSAANSFVLIAEPEAALAITVSNVVLHQPPGKKLTINGTYTQDDQQLTWRNLSFDYAGNLINLHGSYKNPAKNIRAEPYIDYQVQLPDNISANLLGQILSPGIISGGSGGQVKGSLSIQGPAHALVLGGTVYLTDVSLPFLHLNHITGSTSFNDDGKDPNIGPHFSASLQLQQLNMGNIPLSQATGSLIWSNGIDETTLLGAPQSANSTSPVILKNFTAQLDRGQVAANGQADLKQKKAKLELNVKGADLHQLWPQITNSQLNVIGLFNGHFNIETYGDSEKDLEENMSGSAEIHISKGSFGRIAQLNARLNQVNLLHQGLFGFNVNNLMQSVLPAKTSEFNSIDGAFALDQEILTVKHLLYDGQDLKFSTAGKVNLALHSLELDVAGIMPRVSSSVISAKFGEISREITLQKLLDSVTMHKLEKLPSLPVIGGISGGGTEIFTCRILAPYDQPRLISQSIEKSFRWVQRPALPSKKKYL